MIVLFSSVRCQGRSLSNIANELLGKRAEIIASVSFIFILMLTLAGFSLTIVKSLFMSSGSTLIVLATIPIALLMGLYMNRIRPGDIIGASGIGLP